MPDALFCSHFPFTEEARQYAREKGLSLDQNAIELGLSRIVSAMKTGTITQRATELQDDLNDEILSYAASRVILSFMKNRYVSNRMAVAESKRSASFLRSGKHGLPEHVKKVAIELGLEFSQHGENYSLPVWQYLASSPHSIDYKLANMQLKQGKVIVSPYQRIRIIEEAIRKKIEASSPPKLAKYPEGVKECAQKILSLVPKDTLEPTSIANEDFPPCIMHLLSDIRSSVNVSHNGRVALAIYLVKAGLSDKQIIKIFANAPDFNLETTTYQAQYIRKKAYSMPSCATMDSWGLCVAQCRCFNPLKFRRKLHGRNVRKEEWPKEAGK